MTGLDKDRFLTLTTNSACRLQRSNVHVVEMFCDLEGPRISISLIPKVGNGDPESIDIEDVDMTDEDGIIAAARTLFKVMHTHGVEVVSPTSPRQESKNIQ